MADLHARLITLALTVFFFLVVVHPCHGQKSEYAQNVRVVKGPAFWPTFYLLHSHILPPTYPDFDPPILTCHINRTVTVDISSNNSVWEYVHVVSDHLNPICRSDAYKEQLTFDIDKECKIEVSYRQGQNDLSIVRNMPSGVNWLDEATST